MEISEILLILIVVFWVFDGISTLLINKESQRIKKETLEEYENKDLYLTRLFENTDLYCKISRKQILEIMENIIKEHYKDTKPSNSEYLEVVEEIQKIINNQSLGKCLVITETVKSSQKSLMDAITLDISKGVQTNIMDIYHMLYDLILINKNYNNLTYVEIIFVGTVINTLKLNLRDLLYAK